MACECIECARVQGIERNVGKQTVWMCGSEQGYKWSRARASMLARMLDTAHVDAMHVR